MRGFDRRRRGGARLILVLLVIGVLGAGLVSFVVAFRRAAAEREIARQQATAQGDAALLQELIEKGRAHLDAEEWAAARNQLTAGREIAMSVVARDPTQLAPDVIAALHETIGRAELEMGEVEAALASTRKALDVYFALYDEAPDDARWARGVDRVARIRARAGAAGDGYPGGQAVVEKISAEIESRTGGAAGTPMCMTVGYAYLAMGDALLEAGRGEDAINAYSEADNAARALVEQDFGSLDYAWLRAQAFRGLGETAIVHVTPGEAVMHALRWAAIMNDLIIAEPDSLEWIILRGDAMLRLGEFHMAASQPDRGRDRMMEAQAAYETALMKDEGNARATAGLERARAGLLLYDAGEM